MNAAEMAFSCLGEGKSEQQIKNDFCMLFIAELKKSTGEELGQHLSKIMFDKRTWETSVIFSFPCKE